MKYMWLLWAHCGATARSVVSIKLPMEGKHGTRFYTLTRQPAVVISHSILKIPTLFTLPFGNSGENPGRLIPVEPTVVYTNQLMEEKHSTKFTKVSQPANWEGWPLL